MKNKRAKMCKYLKMGWTREACLDHGIGHGQVVCPENANESCQLIAPKKSKTVKVKGWAMFLADGSFGFAQKNKNVIFDCKRCIISYDETIKKGK